MNTTERIYRTADGALVREGDPSGVVLAYGEGDPVENRDAAEVAALLEGKAKKAPAPRNKKAPAPDSK